MYNEAYFNETRTLIEAKFFKKFYGHIVEFLFRNFSNIMEFSPSISLAQFLFKTEHRCEHSLVKLTIA